jgi:hypothetical protein
MKVGGYRPGGGRPPVKPKNEITKNLVSATAPPMLPLDYMLAVMNDPTADYTRRDRMAIAAASFCHPRMAETGIGKKEVQRLAAARGGTGTEWSALISGGESGESIEIAH